MNKINGKLEIGKNLEKIISEMDIGEIAYTNPINLEFDYDFNGYLYLNGTIKSYPDIKNNQTLYVKKIGENKQDYIVDINYVENYKWERTDFPCNEDIEEINNPMYNHPIANLGKINYKKPEKKKSIDEQIKDAIAAQDYELAKKLKDSKTNF
jgi:hypothetical protein